MDSKESSGSCDHDISNVLFCYQIHILLDIAADHALYLIVVIIRKLVAACGIFHCFIITNQCGKLTDRRIFENISIYDTDIL